MLLTVVSVLWPGCSSTERTEQLQKPVAGPPAASLSFEATRDTVTPHFTPGMRADSLQGPGREIRYMIQIGAFKDPSNASQVQALARERFRIPVLNDYHTMLKLYQIRIGFFETFDEADKFRRRLKSEFADDYKDAWIVQLLR
jgi:cell division protein FtsN